MNEQNKSAMDLFQPGEIIDFASLARVLWQRRVFIAYGFIILTIIGALVVLLAPKRYRCEAFFQVGRLTQEKTGMPIPIFKQGEVLLHDLDHLRALMALDRSIGEGERKSFFKRNRDGGKLKKYFAPVTNYTKIAPLSHEEGSSIIGFKLSYTGRTSDSAKKFVEFFGNYIRGSYLVLALDDYILLNLAYNRRSIRECESKELEHSGQLERLNQKKEKLELLAKRFPGFSRGDELQLQKMPNASIHYLSPQVQLKAVESQVLDIHIAAEGNARKKKISIVSLKFFAQARKLCAVKKDNGADLLAALQALRTDMFAGESLRTPAALQVENKVSMDLERFQDMYWGVFGFVTGLGVSLENTLPARMGQVIVISIFSLLFMVITVLLLFWGSKNRKKIAG